MAIDKITPRQLNKDEDYLLVKTTEMVDALNVRMTEDDDGNRGVLKNIKGNTEITLSGGDVLPAGTNRIVGTCSYNQKDLIFFFVWNSNDDHCIYQINTSGTATKVLTGSYLQLDKTSVIHSSAIEDANNEILLYFTDGVNEIKKINITKALDTNITYPAGSDDAEKLLEITLAKKPPLEPLTFEFRSDDTINSNNIYEKSFQFAYQYIYRDGEVSALSPISSVAFSPWAANRANIRPPYTTADNHIRLTMKTSTEAVEKVRVLMRNNNIDTFALVKDIEVTTAGTDETYDFYNDGLYPLIATNESDKPYDAVPKKAQALTISNNRLFLGNYTEGFDYELPANINLKAHYLPTPKGVDASVSKQTGQPKNIDIDLSNLPDLIEGNRSVFVKIALEYTEFNVGSPSGVNTFDIIIGTTTKTYNVYNLNVIPGTVVFATEIKLTNAQYTKAQFGAACATAIGNLADQEVGAGYSTSNFSKVAVNDLATQYNSNFEGSMVFEIDSSSYDSVNDKIDVNVNVKSYDLVCTYIQLDRFDYAERITDTFTYNGGYTLDGGADSNISYFTLPISPNEVTTFKSNADHSFGIVYYDNRGRATGVRDIGSVHVASWGAGERDGRNGAAKVIVDIPNDAPASASAYSIVYAKNNRYDNYQQYSVMEAFKATNEDIAEVGADVGNENIYVSLASIQGKEDSYGSAKVPGVKFTAAEGDKLRIVRYYDRTKGEYVYPEDHEFEVIGIKTFNHDNSPIEHDHTHGTAKQQEYRITGDFLVLRNELYPGFAHSALGTADTSGTDNWHEAVTVELYTPKRSTDVKLYYEMGYNFLVNSSGKHVGNATTQGETQEIDIISQVGQTITIAGSDELTISPGDYVTFSRTPGATQYQINSIQYTSTTTIIEFVSAIPASQTQIFWTASVSRVVVKDGDCFLVPKELRYHDRTVTYAPNNFDNKVYETNFVESNNITDYFDSETLSYGKAYAIIDNEREVTRKASITYSDPYNQSSRRLTLSNFTPANIPFYDFDVSKGGIYGLVDMKNYIMGLQEDSVMKIPVGANILDSASGDNIPTISTNVLSRPIEYQGVFGINTQRDAFISFEGAVFLADIYRGKMWKVTNDAVAEISDTGMSSYFNKKFSEFKTYESSTNKIFIKLGFDRDNNELIVSGVKYNGTAFTDDFTVAYNFRRDLWSSFYSFVGEGYAELNNILYSFKNGKAYSHNSNNSRNTFYGTSYTSKIEIVSNPNPSMVKSWEALNIEGDTAWDFTAYTTDQETSTVTTLSKKERLFYSHIPRDTSSISTSEFITLGEVTDIDNLDNVTINNPINKIPFSGGDAVYADGVDTSEVMTALTARNKFTMSDVNVLSVGDIVSVKKNSDLEGDQLRDRYIRIKLEKSSSTALELYGVGVVFDRSRLHNDLVN
jgi:hypothetical protein